jgi:hypothetical protein
LVHIITTVNFEIVKYWYTYRQITSYKVTVLKYFVRNSTVLRQNSKKKHRNYLKVLNCYRVLVTTKLRYLSLYSDEVTGPKSRGIAARFPVKAKNFPFSETSRGCRLTQPPALSPSLKYKGRKADHSIHLVSR